MHGEELGWISNRAEKVFYRMRHERLVYGISNLEFLTDFSQLKEKSFGFIGHRRSEVWNSLNDVVDKIIECLSWFNWCVSIHRGANVDWDTSRKSKSVH